VGLAVAALSAVAIAQQPPRTVFRGGSGAVVYHVATVTDGENRLVPNLTRDDFEVFDDDELQPLTVFDDSVQPITVVVMLDTSASMTESIALLKSAAEQFLLRLLPEDKGAVGAFNDKIEMSAGFTSDRDALISHVKDLDYGNDTRLYDALAESLVTLQGGAG
jgi:VWFA-related protein